MKAKFLGVLTAFFFSLVAVSEAQIAGSLTSTQPVKVQLISEYKQYLSQEPVSFTVRIINYSGETLQLDAEPEWISFSVEPIARKGTVRQNGPLDLPSIAPGKRALESGMMANVPVTLAPQFELVNPGPYKVVAKFKAGRFGEFASQPFVVDIVSGNTLWQQEFGVPTEQGKATELRKYRIIQMRNMDVSLLFVKVTDVYDTTVYGLKPLGIIVIADRPEQMTDKANRLHVLHRSGPNYYTYSMVGHDGKILIRMRYEYSGSPPRLGNNDNGDVVIVGGLRVKTPADIDPLSELKDNINSTP